MDEWWDKYQTPQDWEEELARRMEDKTSGMSLSDDQKESIAEWCHNMAGDLYEEFNGGYS